MYHNFVFQLTFYPFQDKINSYRLTTCNHDIVQIYSRHVSHSVTHSNSSFRYNTDTLQTWKSFCYLFNIQYRYTPDTEVILSLIQT